MRELCFVPLTDGRIAIGAVGVRTADGALQPLIPHNAKCRRRLDSAPVETKSQIYSPAGLARRLAAHGRGPARAGPRRGRRAAARRRASTSKSTISALRANLAAMETSTSSLPHADGECDPVRWAASPTARTLPRPRHRLAAPSRCRRRRRRILCAARRATSGAAAGRGRAGRRHEVAPAFTASRLWPPAYLSPSGSSARRPRRAVVGAAAARSTRANFGARRRRRPRRPRGARGGAGRRGGAHRSAREFGAAAAEYRQRPRRPRPRRCSRRTAPLPAAFASASWTSFWAPTSCIGKGCSRR